MILHKSLRNLSNFSFDTVSAYDKVLNDRF